MSDMTPEQLDFENNFALALGEGEPKTWRGMKWNVRFLDVADIISFQKRFPGGAFALDTNNLEQVQYFFYLALRKSDPRLSAADIDAEQWKITENQVGRLLTLKTMSDKETAEFLNYLLVGTGIAESEQETKDRAKK